MTEIIDQNGNFSALMMPDNVVEQRGLACTEKSAQNRHLDSFGLNLSNIDHYFFFISLPQHISGTLQASPDPAVQVQVFFTSNSSPQASQ
ncbi:hypothetical protein [Desulfosarcina variabilis]|uniref:hypothetical protein n=1 Tax=Desulfosarcina variabilis TaxID=2300 RepID=UPI003AFAFD5B